MRTLNTNTFAAFACRPATTRIVVTRCHPRRHCVPVSFEIIDSLTHPRAEEKKTLRWFCVPGCHRFAELRRKLFRGKSLRVNRRARPYLGGELPRVFDGQNSG